MAAEGPCLAELLAAPVGELALWTRGGRGVAGRGGTVLALTGPRRLQRLAGLWRLVDVGVVGTAGAAVALVSSTFDDDSPSPSLLHVPAELVRVGTGDDARPERWAQAVDPASLRAALDADAALAGASHGARVAETADVVGPRVPGGSGAAADDDDGDAAAYTSLVRDVLGDIESGTVAKVVTARQVRIAAAPQVLDQLPARLAQAYPDAWTYAVGGLVGASPEMLAARRGDRIASRVLAGSLPRGERPDDELVAELLADPRMRSEHEHAARSVLDPLRAVAALDDEQPEPYVLTLPNIHHLATDVAGRLAEGAGLLDVVDAIHPTAAVAGTPRAAAMAIIARRERHDRGRYAGPVGWLDSAGDGEIGLALRCGQVEGASIRLHAGGGIVAGADPDAELAETESKLRPVREALAAAAADLAG
ncbi:isochorismate synthase [Georgenia sp. Z1344]|uniref:isochorismate synthase n=1 Tax=Georgenia sp. Z1344 TaxID=3416706 RepID=UPI003CF1F8B9